MKLTVIAVLSAVVAFATCSPVRLVRPVGESENCQDCRLAMSVFHGIFGLNFSKNKIVSLIVYFCSKFKIEDNNVCRGITSVFRDEFLYVINQMVLSPDQLCPILIPDCGNPHFPYYKWDVPLPSTPKPHVVEPELPPAVSPTLRILHISDLHMDEFYNPGAEVDCGEPVCCRTKSAHVNQAAGKWGTVAKCDAPRPLVENTFDYISKNEQERKN